MSTLTLGIVVIIYMFILAWLGYIRLFAGGTESESHHHGPFIRGDLYFRIGHCWFRRGCSHIWYGNPMALLIKYVYGRCHRFYHIRAEHP